jgi:hypothetical protein
VSGTLKKSLDLVSKVAHDISVFSILDVLEIKMPDLSRITGSLVISRNTAFTYRNKPVDTKQIGRELGVRYVLEGSAPRSGNKIRVNAQLIDAETDTHLWAEQLDGDIRDLFALQNEITSRIAVALNLELSSREEGSRPTENPDALDYVLRGRALYMRGMSPDRVTEMLGPVRTRIDARSAFCRGVKLDGARARGPRRERMERITGFRLSARRGARQPSAHGITSRLAYALRQGHGAKVAGAMRGCHSRI